jgi:hypothetical protein
MCRSGVTCLTAECCFSPTLRVSLVHSWHNYLVGVAYSRHDIQNVAQNFRIGHNYLWAIL